MKDFRFDMKLNYKFSLVNCFTKQTLKYTQTIVYSYGFKFLQLVVIMRQMAYEEVICIRQGTSVPVQGSGLPAYMNCLPG